MSELPTYGIVYAYFSDIRDAQRAAAKLRSIHARWDVAYIERNAFASLLNMSHSHRFEPAVIVSANCPVSRSSFDTASICTIVQNFLSSFGEVEELVVLQAQYPAVMLKVNYYDCEVAQDVVLMREIQLAGVVLRMQLSTSCKQPHHCPGRPIPSEAQQDMLVMRKPNNGSDTTQSLSPIALSGRGLSLPELTAFRHESTYADPGQNARGLCQRMSGLSASYPPHQSLALVQRPHHRDLQRYNHPGANVPVMSPSRGYNQRYDRRASDSMSMHHNIVDIGRISQGVDVRTTVCYVPSSQLIC